MSTKNPAEVERPEEGEPTSSPFLAGVEEAGGVAAPKRIAAIDEPPPFLGSWRNVHLLVLGELAVLVILFYALTRWAS